MTLCSPRLRGLQDLLRDVGVRHPRLWAGSETPL